jgi:predicted helicase
METKDLGVNLDEAEKSEQLNRYFEHLPNLILTDYLEVRWYVRRERGIKREGSGHLGRLAGSKIVSNADEQKAALDAIDNFLRQKPAPIYSARELAIRLADFTQMIRSIIVEAFAKGEASDYLRDWRAAFARTLLPELESNPDPKKEREAVSEFADMFAQTLSYGLFSARAAGPGGGFSREKARKLVPRTNPFLRDFFEQITGSKLDDEPFAGFVEDIIQTLGHADIDAVLRDFGTGNRRSDPVVHFYETFLHAYGPKLRELRGVYYTPEPVVNYIVESLDELLKDKFEIKDGLADRSKITVTRKEGEQTVREESHRVLILDPATGTATFLYRVLDFIRQQFERRKRAGAWGDYVHEHLLPRLFGFELLMAPYAVAHFKLGLALAARDHPELWQQQWSYEPQKGERINVFLTNTLEDLEETTEQLGPLRMLSDEANSAFEIKKHKPVLVILGNPPYSGHSANKGEWIKSLVRDYYQCDGKPLGERNPKWLQDDYVKFIRWAQWRIERTGQGILGFITNHGYLDNPTFRGMRQNLMQSFDEIYLLDLHGNSKKKEIDRVTGAPDKNVFDIQQGVAIGIFVKLPADPEGKKKGCIVRHADLYSGQLKVKYEWLEGHEVASTRWTKVEPESPNYLFIPQDKGRLAEYQRGWKMSDAMPANVLGFQSHRDDFAIAFSRDEIENRMSLFRDERVTDQEVRAKFSVSDSGSWKIAKARAELRGLKEWKRAIVEVEYRPFDHRWCYLHTVAVDRPRPELITHVARQQNICFNLLRQTKSTGWRHALASCYPTPALFLEIKDGSSVFPLYLYPDGKLPDGDLFVREEPEEKRRPNFSAAFIEDFCERLKVKFILDGLGKPSKRLIGPEMIFNYAYAVFYSPGYRERYAEFLRTDFPRLPLTSDYTLFKKLAAFGADLVDLHARNQANGSAISFPIKGSNKLGEVRYQPPQTHGQDRHPGRVWINKQQYFEGVAPLAWNFPIGGYHPAERWLKDRKGRTLSYEDKETYTRIVAALAETRGLMSEIEKTIHKHGGWPKAFK